MVWQNAKSDTGKVVTLRPIMDGADYFRDASALPPRTASRSENLDTTRGTLARRKGAVKLAQLAVGGTAGASRTFGTTGKYATFTPPLVPVGGWAIGMHFAVVYPASLATAYVMGARPAGQSWHVMLVTISDSGIIHVEWRDSAGATHYVNAASVTDGTTVHLLAVYDAAAGTFTLYVNGAVSGTPLTGLSATLKPDQTAGVVWTFGVEKQTGQAVTASTNFDGKFDGLTLWTLRGTRPASGTTTLAATLLKHSGHVWTNPQMDGVLAHYDLDEASGTVMYDRSQYKNHGAYVGSPSVTAPVAMIAAPTNMIARIIVPAGAWNLVSTFGNLFYEAIGPAAT